MRGGARSRAGAVALARAAGGAAGAAELARADELARAVEATCAGGVEPAHAAADVVERLREKAFRAHWELRLTRQT